VTLERFAWRLQFAVLVLPALASCLMVVARSMLMRASLGTDAMVQSIAAQVFGLVLLSSLALNAWLRVRRTDGASPAAMPRFDARVQVILAGLIVVWLLAAFTSAFSGNAVLGIATPILAISVAVMAVVAYPFARRAGWTAPRVSRPVISLAWPVLVLALTVCIALVSVVHFALNAEITSSASDVFYYNSFTELDSAIAWAEITVGLPWSVPIVVFAFLPLSSTSLLSLAIAPAVLINAAIALTLIVSPAARSAFTTRILTRKPREVA
jgi:hypothetical protein